MRDTSYHPDWQKNRVRFLDRWLTAHRGPNFLHGKSVLELGAHNGFIGECLRQMGAQVTSVDGRQINCQAIKAAYPDLNVLCANLDTPDWLFGNFDVIINFGLFYHLNKFHVPHFKNCLAHCDLMFFETVVLDSQKNQLRWFSEQPNFASNDQGLEDRTGIPTLGYMDDLLKGTRAIKIASSELNGGGQLYDWPEQGLDDPESPTCRRNYRKMWIIEPSAHPAHTSEPVAAQS